MPALTTVDRLSVKLAFWPLLRQVRRGPANRARRRDGLNRAGSVGTVQHRRSSPGAHPRRLENPGVGARLDTLEKRFGSQAADRDVLRLKGAYLPRPIPLGRSPLRARKNGLLAVEDLEGEISNVGPGTSPRFNVSARFLADAGRNVVVKGAFGPPAPGMGLAETPFHASFSAEDLALTRLGPYLPTLRRHDPGVLSIHGTLDGAPPGLLKVSGTVALVAATQSPAIPSFDAALALMLDRPNGSVRIERSAFALAKLPLTAEGRIRGLPDAPSLDLRIATPAAVSIEDLLTRLPGFARSVPRASSCPAVCGSMRRSAAPRRISRRTLRSTPRRCT